MVMLQSSLDKIFHFQYIVLYIDWYTNTFKCMSIKYLKYSYRYLVFCTELKHLGDNLLNSWSEFIFSKIWETIRETINGTLIFCQSYNVTFRILWSSVNLWNLKVIILNNTWNFLKNFDWIHCFKGLICI